MVYVRLLRDGPIRGQEPPGRKPVLPPELEAELEPVELENKRCYDRMEEVSAKLREIAQRFGKLVKLTEGA